MGGITGNEKKYEKKLCKCLHGSKMRITFAPQLRKTLHE